MSGIDGRETHALYYAVSEGHDEVVEYFLSKEVEELIASFEYESKPDQLPYGLYNPTDINRPAQDDKRTPVLEAIRWNRQPIVELLIARGADPKAVAKNPFSNEINWTGFHILATAGHDSNYSGLMSILVDAGLPINGIPGDANAPQHSIESPFLVAIQHNAFNLATAFIEHGADPNFLSLSAGLVSLDHPTTVLGHLVAASAQHTTPRLRYLLEQCPKRDTVDFIVEPARQLSALHRAAWAHKGVLHRAPDDSNGKYLSQQEYDMLINREIMHELLQKWGDDAAHLNARCQVHGRTALHLAVEAANLKAVELLVEKGADVSIVDDLGLIPAELAQELFEEACEQHAGTEDVYAAIITVLLGD